MYYSTDVPYIWYDDRDRKNGNIIDNLESDQSPQISLDPTQKWVENLGWSRIGENEAEVNRLHLGRGFLIGQQAGGGRSRGV